MFMKDQKLDTLREDSEFNSAVFFSQRMQIEHPQYIWITRHLQCWSKKKSQLNKRSITFLWRWRRIHDMKHMTEFIKGLKGSLWGSQQRSCLPQHCLLCLHFMSQLWYLHSTEMERKLPHWLRLNFSPNLLEYRLYIGFIVALSYVL